MELKRNKTVYTKMFKNQFLETISKTSRTNAILIYLITAFGLMFWGTFKYSLSLIHVLLLFGIGLFLWTLSEYLFHRYAFHFKASSKIGKRITYVIHGIHHETPKDKERIIMPPIPGITIILLFFLFVYVFINKYSFPFTSGWLVGYLFYSWVHYHIHMSKPVPLFKYWWIHHSLHHFQQQEKAFGVSSPLWDFIFGTMPSMKKKDLP